MYSKHCENLREIEGAIKLVESDLRRYISMEQESKVYKYTKILSYLVTCWSEVRILKLTYEDNAFSQSEIGIIINSGTLADKWKNALKIAVCKAYNLNPTVDFVSLLPFTPKSRYLEIHHLIESDLLPSIEIRNRIAHGQWKYAFTNDLRNTNTQLTGHLRQENIVKLQLKRKLLTGLSFLIHDLIISEATFDRDFDKNYRLIEENKRNLHKRDYASYKLKMVEKYQRGKLKRKENLETE
ncbi:hypothetical protein DMZ43_05470 [Meridianimaribacter sp. CL38]|uniref:hypothetical protein n=1 Tax=Meridianimaribacter sp. CL38 TaxID=2213021 RepID=UPI00103C8629|nr:hypothetical protein [Meridianimaribacter sp. CL38]TBV26518.1 hypothetical protein DMZ43_05470 [Meridianimaribacter sp. CL38]